MLRLPRNLHLTLRKCCAWRSSSSEEDLKGSGLCHVLLFASSSEHWMCVACAGCAGCVASVLDPIDRHNARQLRCVQVGWQKVLKQSKMVGRQALARALAFLVSKLQGVGISQRAQNSLNKKNALNKQ